MTQSVGGTGAVLQVMWRIKLKKGRQMNKTSWLAAALLLCITPMASASVALVAGTGTLGSYTGSLDYTSNGGGTAATLIVSLTNTSPALNGGYLTAFALNNPGGIAAIPLLTSSSASFSTLLNDPDNVNGSPFGQFDFGATTNGSWSGGGSPSAGLGVGASGTFTFSLTGAGLNLLSASSFLSTLSTGTGAGEGYKAFAVRFRGFEDKGSDKVPGTEVIPEPASLAVWGCIGLMGIPYGIYRRRKAVTA